MVKYHIHMRRELEIVYVERMRETVLVDYMVDKT
jgi:hypothetical protein